MDCNYPFPIDLAPAGIPIGAQSIGKWELQSKLGSIKQDSENISLCVHRDISKVKILATIFVAMAIKKHDSVYHILHDDQIMTQYNSLILLINVNYINDNFRKLVTMTLCITWH